MKRRKLTDDDKALIFWDIVQYTLPVTFALWLVLSVIECGIPSLEHDYQICPINLIKIIYNMFY